MEIDLAIPRHASKVISTIEQTDEMYLSVLKHLGLPVENVLSTIDERKKAIRNIPEIIFEVENISDAYYLSKFLIAISTGLFDAALNYLWDETIKQLRLRVIQVDLKYFFDIIVPDAKRKDFSCEEDLKKLDDSTLIEGARKIDLISEIGYKHLDFIRYMRNRASAAHPNTAELTGLNLVSWLETCIREVISTPLSSVQVRINELLANIKTVSLNQDEAETISCFFGELSGEKCNLLARGLFGIYTDEKTSQETIANINLLIPKLWVFVSEHVRADFGIRHTTFMAHGDEYAKKSSRRFLEQVSGLSYLTDEAKTPQIKRAIEQLEEAHKHINNFYNEPLIARELLSIIGEHGDVPKALYVQYITTLVSVFLTNGNGVAWHAEPKYIEMLKKLNVHQTYLALTSFRRHSIKSKLQFSLCRNKFSELLDLIEGNITSDGMKELFMHIKKKIDILYELKDDSRLMLRILQFDKNYSYI